MSTCKERKAMPKHTFPPGVHLKGGRNAAPVLAELAREFYAPLIPIVVELRDQGLSLREIAAELEKRGIKARWGWTRWSAAQVRRILARAAEQQQGRAAVPAPAPAVPTPVSEACSTRLGATPASAPRPAPSAPAASAAGIYLRIGSQSWGPFIENVVQMMLDEHRVGPGTMARRSAADEWRPLGEVLGTADE
jgi:Recombinase